MNNLVFLCYFCLKNIGMHDQIINLSYEGFFADGQEHGILEQWYENDIKKTRIIYCNPHNNGILECFFENARIRLSNHNNYNSCGPDIHFIYG